MTPPSEAASCNLILFVTGDSPRSQRARSNLENALEQVDPTHTDYAEVDLLEEPQKTFEYGVFATPALLDMSPDGPPRPLYGDLSDTARLERFLRAVGNNGNAIG